MKNILIFLNISHLIMAGHISKFINKKKILLRKILYHWKKKKSKNFYAIVRFFNITIIFEFVNFLHLLFIFVYICFYRLRENFNYLHYIV